MSIVILTCVYMPRFNYLITISSNSTDKEHLMSPPILFVVFLSQYVYVCVLMCICVIIIARVCVYVCVSLLFHVTLRKKASKFSLSNSNPYIRRQRAYVRLCAGAHKHT